MSRLLVLVRVWTRVAAAKLVGLVRRRVLLVELAEIQLVLVALDLVAHVGRRQLLLGQVGGRAMLLVVRVRVRVMQLVVAVCGCQRGLVRAAALCRRGEQLVHLSRTCFSLRLLIGFLRRFRLRQLIRLRQIEDQSFGMLLKAAKVN